MAEVFGLGGLLLGALAGLPPTLDAYWEPPAAPELTNLDEATRCLVCPCVDEDPDKCDAFPITLTQSTK